MFRFLRQNIANKCIKLLLNNSKTLQTRNPVVAIFLNKMHRNGKRKQILYPDIKTILTNSKNTLESACLNLFKSPFMRRIYYENCFLTKLLFTCQNLFQDIIFLKT